MKKVVVAGATGNLGLRITKALRRRNIHTVALIRGSIFPRVHAELINIGAHVTQVDMDDGTDIARACDGATCVVSALAGLGDVVIDTQTRLLGAAISAAVPRFIPSDFCTDFRQLTKGDNRNFDLRRDFHDILSNSAIASTSIYNGAFAEVLKYGIPLMDHRKRTVTYWGSPDWKIDFSAMDDIAEFSAEAAIDSEAPRALRIASFQKSPNDLVTLASELWDTPYQLVRLGSVEELRLANQRQRLQQPDGELDLYCGWQQSQYMHSMLSAHHNMFDNDRYGNLRWTSPQTLFQ